MGYPVYSSHFLSLENGGRYKIFKLRLKCRTLKFIGIIYFSLKEREIVHLFSDVSVFSVL
jgi:hypothetical protein